MLNFRTTSLALFLISVLVLILLLFNVKLGLFPGLVLVIWISLLVFGSVNIRTDFYVKAFCKGKTSEKLVCLTFDDGPDPSATPEILEILEKNKIQATFFVIGQKAEQHPELLKLIEQKGHLIGNHSFSHAFFFDLFGRKKMEQDLLKAEDIIQNITGKKTGYFRPPYGVTNPVLAKVVNNLGYKVIGWSVRSLDTVKKNENEIISRIKKGLHPGAVILMHDDREITAKVLERVILMVKEDGYRFVGLKEMMEMN
jgi:peptidoglycan/xylan/chitin deacetylase (PgdA/CDA1 family)